MSEPFIPQIIELADGLKCVRLEDFIKAREHREQLNSLLASHDACWDEIIAVLGQREQGDQRCDLDRVLKAIRERDEAREELARIESLLLDPHAVFVNFLHGKIAKLDWSKLEHIHGPHPARKSPAWIPVSQAIPDADQTVIVHFEDRRDFSAPGEVWTGFLDGTTWRFVSGDRIEAEVTHWMPFPPPPEE